MRKYLSGSANTGKKIMADMSLFKYTFKDVERFEDNKIFYKYTWSYCSQHGYFTILMIGSKISESSLIGTDTGSPRPFGKTLAMYNDPSLFDLFSYIIQHDKGINVTGACSVI